MDEVLDSSYSPATMEEDDLFDKKSFYSVFNRVSKADKRKSFVRQHKVDYDAQNIFTKLVDYHTNSTKTALEVSKLLSYITLNRIDSPS